MQTIKTRVTLTAQGRRVTARASGAAGRVSYVFQEDDTPGHDYMDQHAAAARALLVRLEWRGVYVAGAMDTRGAVVWVNRDGVTVDGKPEPRDMSELIERVTDAGGHWFDESTMRFFRTRIASGLFPCGERFRFLTSEQRPGGRREWTVREWDPARPANVATVGEFCGYASRRAALRDVLK
jgi:hypothetical protein